MEKDEVHDDHLRRPRSIRLTEAELKNVVKETVHETFITLGVDASDPLEMQKDFQHLREWRETSVAVKSKGLMTLVGIIVAGVAAFVWITLWPKA